MEKRANPGKGALATGGLLLLCLLWAWDSLHSDLPVGSARELSISPLLKEAMLLGMFAVLAGLAALLRKVQWPRSTTIAMTVLVGLVMLVPAPIVFPRHVA